MATAAGTSALEAYRDARRRRRNARFLSLLVAGLLVAVAVAEADHHAAVRTVLATCGAAVGVAAVGWVAALAGTGGRDLRRWRRAAAGEAVTADLLSTLPRRRWLVWHDLRVPGSRANIDHLVVGRTGVWVLDTKTTRARVEAGWRSVRFGRRRLDVSATLWEADVVSGLLEESLGDTGPHRLVVRPMVVVHGDGLRPRGGRVSGVPIVAADQLLPRLRRGRRRLKRRHIRVVAAAVDRALGGPGRR